MTIEKKLLGTTPVSGVILPEAVSFDGTNDYLSRSSDMTNNADGKTFTFSCWVYIPSGYAGTIGVYNVGSFWIQPDKDGGLGIVGYGPSGGNPAFYSNLPANTIPLDTYSNILVSINVNGGVSTRLRHVYINDVNVTSSADWYESEGSGWYNDKLINFTPDNGTIRVGANAASQKLKGRLAHVFLDYTYRDLSVTSNRRLFITADGKPADGQGSVYNYALTKLYVGSQDNTPLEVFMSTDGTKFYMVGKTTDKVYQYNLSTAYDVSSASYNSVSFSVASQSTEPTGISFSVDGTKMYIVEASNGLIYQYTLTTGFDLSTASYASKSFDTSSQRSGAEVQDVSISSNGTRLYIIISNHIYEYTLSTAYDVSTATYNSKTYSYSTQVAAGVGMAFGNSGTKLYLMGAVSSIDTVFEYTLSTAWDVSTASYSNNSFIAAGRTNDGKGLALSSNGEHIYSLGYTGDSVFQYDISTAYDLSTASGSAPTGSATTPILYLPMTDAATAGSNSGTGGDFTVNGVLATAERGPNQDNCSASVFNGSADYLFRSSIVGVSDSKQFTFSFNFVHTGGSSGVPMEFRNAATGTYSVRVWQNAASYNIYIVNNEITVLVAHISTADYKSLNVDTGYKQNNVSISFDLSDTNKRYVYLNGTAATVTWETYTNQLIDMSQLNNWRIGNSGTGSAWWNGQLGEVYFNTAYTDLATSNPFWDSDTNRPNSVRKVIADTSVTPLIALPIVGNDAGNNLGSGGDFTVNSGPYTGARGGSEFWARSAHFNGSSTDLTNTSLTGLSTGKQFTIAFGYSNFSYSDDVTIFEVGGGGGAGAGVYSKVFFTSSEVKIKCGDGSADHLEISLARGATNGIIMISCDTTGAVDAIDFVIDGTYTDKSSGIIVQNSNITDSSENDSIIGNRLADNQTFNGSLGFVYVDDSYIDFSQEANRNKFVDQLGYPRDLTQQIEDGDISNPLIYMKFENAAALGTNSGSGGNFTVNGPFHAGRDITP